MIDRVRTRDGTQVIFWCPACDDSHTVTVRRRPDDWTWNGSQFNATIMPSVKVTLPYPDGERICHSFVRNGKIEYLSDCTHAYAGKTIEMVNFPEGWGVKEG